METPFQRVIYYATNFDDAQKKFDKAQVDKLVDCADKGLLTHVVIGLFHINKLPGAPDKYRLSWNETPIVDRLPESLSYLKDAIKRIKSKTVEAKGREGAKPVKVLASFGGGGVGDFRHLFKPGNFDTIYPLIENLLGAWDFDGIDLDVEEGREPDGENVTTDNLAHLLSELRVFGWDDFVIAAAPCASAMMGGSTMTPHIDWLDSRLVDLCDFYIVQFYNIFGNLDPDGIHRPHFRQLADYVAKECPELVGKLVAGTPTSSDQEVAPQGGYCNPAWLSNELPKLAARYFPTFGVSGWNFQSARAWDGGPLDPAGWLRAVDFKPSRDFSIGFSKQVITDLLSGRKSPPTLLAIGDRIYLFHQDATKTETPTGGLMRRDAEFSPKSNPVWRNPKHLNDVKISRAPSVVVFQNKVYVFYTDGTHLTLHCLVSADQGKNFEPVTLSGLNESRFFYTPKFAVLPAAGARKERLCLLGVNEAGWALKYAYTEDGTNFVENYTHRDSRPDMPPTLVQLNGKLVGFFCARSDLDYGELFSVVSYDGVNWQFRPQRLHRNTSAAPSAVVHRGLIHLFYRDPTGNGIYHEVSYDEGATVTGCLPRVVVDGDQRPEFIVVKDYLVGAVLNPSRTGSQQIVSLLSSDPI